MTRSTPTWSPKWPTSACIPTCASVWVHQELADSGRASVAGFTGPVLHSVEVARDLSVCAGKRVLMLGAGETASDLAGELTRLTPHLTVSSRRGQWFTNRVSNHPGPKPSLNDYFSSPMRRLLDPTDAAYLTARAVEDRYGPCGSGVPEWQTDRPFQGQFLNKNATLVELWRLGQVTARGAVSHAEGDTVTFSDGRSGQVDVIVLCTGFQTVFPFLPAPYDTARIDTHFKMMLADDPTLSFVGFVRPVVGSIPAIAEMQARSLAALYAGRIPLPRDQAATIAADRAYALRRFDSPRLAGLVDMSLYLDALAVWLDVRPDYAQLLRDRPRQWWRAVNAPHNGAVYRLNDSDDPDAIVDHLDKPEFLTKQNLAFWALVLLRNAFPVRPVHVFSERGGEAWRRVVGVLVTPVALLAGFLAMRGPTPVGQVFGALVLAAFSPLWIGRLWRRQAHLEALRSSFAGRPMPRPTQSLHAEDAMAAK